MMYYISATKLAECMKEANLRVEDLRFYTREPMEEVKKFLAGGPTRKADLLNDICNALNMLPERFAKFQTEPGDESDNLAIIHRLKDLSTPVDPDETHYHEWGKEPLVFQHES